MNISFDLIQQLRSEPRTKLCDEAADALEKLQAEYVQLFKCASGVVDQILLEEKVEKLQIQLEAERHKVVVLEGALDLAKGDAEECGNRLAALNAVPKVRQLEWGRLDHQSCAATEDCEYNCWKNSDGTWIANAYTIHGRNLIAEKVDRETAEAKCQSDLETRVLSCLQPCPTPTAAPCP